MHKVKEYFKNCAPVLIFLGLVCNPYAAAASDLLPYGINGYHPGSGREATQVEKDFTYIGFSASKMALLPENAIQMQQIGFAVFQDLLNQLGNREASGRLVGNNFEIAPATSGEFYNSLDSLEIRRNLGLGDLQSDLSSTIPQLASFPQALGRGKSIFKQTYQIKIPRVTISLAKKYQKNIYNYLRKLKAVNLTLINTPPEALNKWAINHPVFRIFPTKYFFLDVRVNIEYYPTPAESLINASGQSGKVKDISISLKNPGVRVPLTAPRLAHGIFYLTR